LPGFVSQRTRRAFKAFLVRGKDNKISFEFEERKAKPGAAAKGKAAAADAADAATGADGADGAAAPVKAARKAAAKPAAKPAAKKAAARKAPAKKATAAAAKK